MKRILLSILSIIGILFILDYLIYRGVFLLGEGQWLYIIDFLLKSIFIFLLIINVLYKRAFTLNSNKTIITIFIILPLILSMLIADRLVALNKFYYYSKTLNKSFSGLIWQYDDSLSYKGLPYSQGSYNYYLGDTIEGRVPLIFDSLGFRTVPDSLRINSDSTDLYLGCSYTFGDFVEAQNTYSYLTSKFLNHNYINAAIVGYGAGQMVQIAEKLLPKRKFSYVFIQLSSWIVPRAMEINGPTRFGYRPFPYYSETGSSFKLNLPAYKTRMYSIKNWRKTQRSYFEKMFFSFTDGYKIEIHDYYSFKFAELKIRLGILPKPTQNKTALEIVYYDHLIDLCLRHMAVPVVLKLMYPDKDCETLVRHIRKKAKIIDLDSVLQTIVSRTGIKYGKLFKIHHVQNNDSINFDSHPNKFAHSIFSETIYNALKRE